ncbi:MAG TPA: GFA family protein [Pyrinomonadaceae bacterium]|jgi:hypothetical protein|nr:GFA family protein [Candidatus Binatota bacterium]HWN07811.1 GFA family protein [Pyrinomonadaceae bacterium]
MKNKISRRTVIKGGALALVGTAISGSTTAQAQKPDSVKTAAGDTKSAQPSVNKTRVASCNCGQLRVTTNGPDPDRVVMCNCYLCQKQTGSPFSVQARFPNEQVKIEGKSTAWKFPIDGAKPTTYRTCAGSDGITNSAADVVTSHFCPVCGSTVYYFRKSDPARTGVRIGAFADPTFPPPMGSGFEEYKHPWTSNIAALSMPLGHHQ